jgi:hypothetical protein
MEPGEWYTSRSLEAIKGLSRDETRNAALEGLVSKRKLVKETRQNENNRPYAHYQLVDQGPNF